MGKPIVGGWLSLNRALCDATSGYHAVSLFKWAFDEKTNTKTKDKKASVWQNIRLSSNIPLLNRVYGERGEML